MHEPDELCLGSRKGVDCTPHLEPGIRPGGWRLIECVDEAPGQFVAATDAAPMVSLHVAGDTEQPQASLVAVARHPPTGTPRL